VHESPYLRFKSQRISDEWQDNRLNPLLRIIVLAAAYWHFRNTTIPAVLTGLLRTREEQQAIYPSEPNRRSVHEYWRGADLRTTHINILAPEWRDWINSIFPYNGSNPAIMTALVHQVGTHGEHLHLQCGPNERIPEVPDGYILA